MAFAKWKRRRDPLFRGDNPNGVSQPKPSAGVSIVAHVLYLGGAGRDSQFQSTTESEAVARRFAGDRGRVYRTAAPRAEALGVHHRSQLELLGLLRGMGQGDAQWSSAYEVMQARRYVEQWSEHLLDFSTIAPADVDSVVAQVYEP